MPHNRRRIERRLEDEEIIVTLAGADIENCQDRGSYACDGASRWGEKIYLVVDVDGIYG
jgi:hypothetical protein